MYSQRKAWIRGRKDLRLKSREREVLLGAAEAQKKQAVWALTVWFADRKKAAKARKAEAKQKAKVEAKAVPLETGAPYFVALPESWRRNLSRLEPDRREACEYLLSLQDAQGIFFFLRERVLSWLGGGRHQWPLSQADVKMVKGLRQVEREYAEAAG